MWLCLPIYYNLFLVLVLPAQGHIPQYITRPPNRIDHYCGLAETCVHDTIPVCGKNVDEFRQFLDICDMLEWGCDRGEIFSHVRDMDTKKNDKLNCPEIVKQT